MDPAEIQNKPRKQTWYKRRRSTVTGSAPGPLLNPAAQKTPKRPLADATPASGEPSSKIRRLGGNTGKTPARLGPRTPTFATVKAEDEEPWYTVRRSHRDTIAPDPVAGDTNWMTPPLTTRPVDSPLANAGPSAATRTPTVRTPVLSTTTPVAVRNNTPGRVTTRNRSSVSGPPRTPFHDVYDFNERDSEEEYIPGRRRVSVNSRSRPASVGVRSSRASTARATVPSSAAAKTTTTTTTAAPTATVNPPYMTLRSRGENVQGEGSSSGHRYPPLHIKRLPFTHKRPADLVLPGGGRTARWNQTKLKAALNTAVGMSAGTFMKLLETLEEYFERPAALQTGWIWIPCPGSSMVAVEVRKVAYAEFDEELVETVLGKDPERRALVSEGKVPLVGYLFYHTLLAAGTRRTGKQRKVAAKKTQLTLVSSVLSTGWGNE